MQFLGRSILIVEVFNIEVFLKMCKCVLLDVFKDSSYQHLLGTVQGRDSILLSFPDLHLCGFKTMSLKLS